MDSKTLTAAEIQKELDNRRASLDKRLTAIKQEFAPLAEITDGNVPAGPSEPLATTQKVAVAAGATLVIGVLAGLRSRKKKLNRAEMEGARVRLYVDHLLDEAAKLAARGKDPEDALEKVLRRKPAVVQVEYPELDSERSVFSGLPTSFMRTLLIYAAEAGAAWLIAHSTRGASEKSKNADEV